MHSRHVLASYLFLTVISTGFLSASSAGNFMLRDGRRLLDDASEIYSMPAGIQGATVLGPYDPYADIKVHVHVVGQGSPDKFLESLEDPSSPLYQQYVTPQEFAARFGASDQYLQTVSHYLSVCGMDNIKVSGNGMVVTAKATTKQVGDAFQISILSYQSSAGVVFFAPDTQPSIPDSLQGIVLSIVGLDNYPRSGSLLVKPASASSHSQRGSGPQGGMSPLDIASVYNIPTDKYTGAGQVYAIATLAVYNSSDAAAYANYFKLGALNITDVFVGNVSKAFDPNGIETVLDIAMQSALSPRAKIMVYQAINGGTGELDLLMKIADDNLASIVSFSWGSDEFSGAFAKSVHRVLQQMAAQGQSFFVASGDSGCHGSKDEVIVGFPANDPSACAVGGTSFTGTGNYSKKLQSAWTGSGGGISKVWKRPSFQKDVTKKNHRLVPDVALNADPNTGYSIFYTESSGKQGTTVVGGTSAAAPLWASFAGLVNECRASKGLGRIGFLPSKLYPLLKKKKMYAHTMEDIVGGDNGCYKATKSYDEATGLGTFNGAELLHHLCK